MSRSTEYLLGHDDPELERLKLQAQVIAGVSRRLMRDCGIVPGMRVLEIGCGVGDFTMLLAGAVGETGKSSPSTASNGRSRPRAGEPWLPAIGRSISS